MERASTALARLETALADPALYLPAARPELDRILAEQRQQRTRLASAEEAWLTASGELEAAADPV